MLSSYAPKVINNAVVCLGPQGGGSGDGGGCLGWVVQALRGRSRGALWCGWGFGRCTRDFLASVSGGVGAGCSP